MPSQQRSKNLMDPSDETLTGKRQGKGVFETLFDEVLSEYHGSLRKLTKPYPAKGSMYEPRKDEPVTPVSHTPYGDEKMKKEKDLKPIDDPYEAMSSAKKQSSKTEYCPDCMKYNNSKSKLSYSADGHKKCSMCGYGERDKGSRNPVTEAFIDLLESSR